MAKPCTWFKKYATVVAMLALQLSLTRADWKTYWETNGNTRLAGAKLTGDNPVNDGTGKMEGFWQSHIGAMAYICSAPESGFKVNFVLSTNEHIRALCPNMNATTGTLELVHGYNVLCVEQNKHFWIITPQEDGSICFFSTMKPNARPFYYNLKNRAEWRVSDEGKYSPPKFIEQNYIANMLFNDMYVSGTYYQREFTDSKETDSSSVPVEFSEGNATGSDPDTTGNRTDTDDETNGDARALRKIQKVKPQRQDQNAVGSWFCTNEKCNGRGYWIDGESCIVDRIPRGGKIRATRNYASERHCFRCKTEKPAECYVIKEVLDTFGYKSMRKVKKALVDFQK